MEDRESFEGSSTELHKKLESIAEEIGVSIVRDKAWPKSARWVWRRIQEVVPLLVGVGIEASRERDEAGTTIALRRVPTNDASRDHKRVDKPDTAGNTEPDDARANARNTSNASADASRNFAETADSDSTDNTGNRHLHHTAQAERLRRTLEGLIAHHEEQAAKLMDVRPKGA